MAPAHYARKRAIGWLVRARDVGVSAAPLVGSATRRVRYFGRFVSGVDLLAVFLLIPVRWRGWLFEVKIGGYRVRLQPIAS